MLSWTAYNIRACPRHQALSSCCCLRHSRIDRHVIRGRTVDENIAGDIVSERHCEPVDVSASAIGMSEKRQMVAAKIIRDMMMVGTLPCSKLILDILHSIAQKPFSAQITF